MGSREKEVKVGLNIQAKIDKASEQIKILKNQLGNFDLSKSLSNEFTKEFKAIQNELVELQRQTASGEINLIDAKSAEKEINKIEKRWVYLMSKIESEDFTSSSLKADAQAMSALDKIQKEYTKGIKDAESQETRLNKKLEEAKKKQQDLLEIQKQQKVVKQSEIDDQRAQAALYANQVKDAKKARDEAEAALRKRAAENGGKIDRRTKEYQIFKKAQASYDSAKVRAQEENKKADSMVTQEMQAAEAKQAQEAIDKANEALENYRKNSLALSKEDAFKAAKESLQKIEEFKDIDWEGLGIDLSEVKTIEQLEDAMAKLRIEADKRAAKAIEGVGEVVQNTSGDFKGLKKDIDIAEESLEEFDEQAEQVRAFETKIKQFLGMAGAVELLRNALRQAFETTKELDAAMTEMAVVTDLEIGDYWNQLPEHTKRASELGVAIKDVYEAETLYYQQGLKTDQAQALANTTLKMARIAGLDAALATDKMTAALRGFNMELNEASAEKVADVYSELAAITAADVKEISSAMTKTASIASSAGMEFETTAAFLSQIIETTRESAETAGTAMKTVIARFQELKKAPDEIGEIDGEIVDANAIETALRSVGVSLRDAGGQFRELDDVFLELSSKWDSLDKNTQRYIATIAAGSRQQSRFIAMMSDYGRTQELVTAANNSAGASQKQYEKTLESLETKLAQLANAWKEFSMGILENDLVKFGIDALKTFLEIINKATSAFEGLGGTITKVLATVALFKLGQKIFEGIKKPMSDFFTKLVADIYKKGLESGEAYAKGAQEGAKKQQDQAPKEEVKKELTEEEKKKLLPKTLSQRLLGFDSEEYQKQRQIKIEGQQKLANLDAQGGNLSTRTKEFKQNKKALAKLDKQNNKANKQNSKVSKVDDAVYADQKAKTEEAEKALLEYKQTQKETTEAASKQWGVVGQSMQQVGTAITGLGVGISAIGGLVSQIGNKEVGETITTIGNGVMFLGSAIGLIGTMLTAIPPILTIITAHPIIAIITGVCLLLIATIGIIATIAKNNSLNARMEKAAQATEDAKNVASQAKEEYNELLSAKSGYEELQSQLENLTEGTKEWKEALQASNEQVLNLIDTYPELAKYLTRGKSGELEISEEGWDSLIEQQGKAVQNARLNVTNHQLAELDLKKEGATVDEIKAIEQQQKNIARANLSATSSELVLNSDFSDQAANAFASSFESNVFDKAVDKQVAGLKEGSDYRDSAEFDRLAKEYNVASEMNGDDTHDLKVLYAAVHGLKSIDDIPEEIASDREQMLQSISKTDQSNSLIKGMDEYVQKLDTLAQTDKVQAENIAGMLTEEGAGMTKEFAETLLKDGELQTGKVDEYAQALNYKNAEDWASKIGKTTAELYEEIKENAQDAITINTATFSKLKKALGEGANEINKFGTAVTISTENSTNLVTKLIEASHIAGDDKALELKNSIDTLLDAAEDDAEQVAKMIGTMNWNSMADWDSLVKMVENMNLDESVKTQIYSLKDQAIELGLAIETVNFEKVTNEIQKMFDLMKAIQSGEQNRAFSEDSYNTLVQSNSDLANDFVQLGDQFYYLGNSMQDLNTTLKQEAAKEAALASVQHRQQVAISNAAVGFMAKDDLVDYQGNKLDPYKISEASEMQQIAYLNNFRQHAINSGVESLRFLTGEDGKSLGLSLNTNFYKLDKEKRQAAIEAIARFATENSELNNKTDKIVADAQVAQYTLASPQELLDLINRDADGNISISDKDADIYSKALMIQAAESGMVAESVIAEYSDLVAKDLSKLTDTDKSRMGDLETIMKDGIEQNNQHLEQLEKVNEMTNRVAEALQNSRQKEIDKLSEINDNVTSASEKMISKLQEQIDDQRERREEEQQEKAIQDNMSQLAYLLADTSGANTMAALELQKTIQDQQLSYQDQIIDDAIQQLSDDNAAAAEQRQQQIDLLQSQLDHDIENGNIARQAEQVVHQSLEEINSGMSPLETRLYEILREEEEPFTEQDVAAFEAEFWGQSGAAANAYKALTSISDKIAGTNFGLKDEDYSDNQNSNDWSQTEGPLERIINGINSGSISSRNGMAAIKADPVYQQAKYEYESTTGKKDFETQVTDALETGSVDSFVNVTSKNNLEKVNTGNTPTTGVMRVNIEGHDLELSARYATGANSGEKDPRVKSNSDMAATKDLDPKSGWVAAQDGELYIYSAAAQAWLPFNHSEDYEKFKEVYFSKLRTGTAQFKTGGIADFTGPAWLDGTKSHPELVLNARDTENFIQLKDILGEIMKGAGTIKNGNKDGGDNYYTIDINVEELKDDYDVEQLANKIRSMLYEDASYRNVTAVSFSR